MTYRDFTIEPDYYGYYFYKTDEGVDCKWTGDSLQSNCQLADSIDDVKRMIDDYYFERIHYRVERKVFAETEVDRIKYCRSTTITKFTFLEEATRFCNLLGIDVGVIQPYLDGEPFQFDSI